MSKTKTFQTTKVFHEFRTSTKRIRVFQGGTRSGKTYNIVAGWISLLLEQNNKTLTVCRETMPSLKNTVYRDFIEVLMKLGLFDSNNLSKGDMTYKLGTNLIEFRNLDDDQKIRGAKRDYLYINEANEISHAIFKQLLFRTKEIIALDYNPSDEFHWIYDKVLTRDDCDFFKSTYLDNPFLPLEQVQEIERLKELDPNYWRIYGLGERGISESTIFTHWQMCEELPEQYQLRYFGLDFGFNDPNALVEIRIHNEKLYIKEHIYRSQMTSGDIIREMRQLNISSTDTIYADNSRPETIQEVFLGGFNIHPCNKGKGSILAGIDYIKKIPVFITKDSVNLLKEIKSYKWKVNKNEEVLDEPVDINNHCIDAIRYGLNEQIHNRQYTVDVLDNFNF